MAYHPILKVIPGSKIGHFYVDATLHAKRCIGVKKVGFDIRVIANKAAKLHKATQTNESCHCSKNALECEQPFKRTNVIAGAQEVDIEQHLKECSNNTNNRILANNAKQEKTLRHIPYGTRLKYCNFTAIKRLATLNHLKNYNILWSGTGIQCCKAFCIRDKIAFYFRMLALTFGSVALL